LVSTPSPRASLCPRPIESNTPKSPQGDFAFYSKGIAAKLNAQLELEVLTQLVYPLYLGLGSIV